MKKNIFWQQLHFSHEKFTFTLLFFFFIKFLIWLRSMWWFFQDIKTLYIRVISNLWDLSIFWVLKIFWVLPFLLLCLLPVWKIQPCEQICWSYQLSSAWHTQWKAVENCVTEKVHSSGNNTFFGKCEVKFHSFVICQKLHVTW